MDEVTSSLLQHGAEDESTESVNIIHDEKRNNDDNWKPISSTEHTFVPAIEGLRGIAVSMTIFGHVISGPNLLKLSLGPVGVNMFFVLSGYLITGVLVRLQKRNMSKMQKLSSFYCDRFARLSPALSFMIIVMSLAHLYAGRAYYIPRYSFIALFYVQNISFFWSQPYEWGPFGNLWSLAVEEHFYILWSLIIPFIIPCSTRTRIIFFSTAIVSSFSLRIYLSFGGGSFWYLCSFTSFGKMFTGAALRFIPLPPFLTKRKCTWLGLSSIFATLALLSVMPKPVYTGWLSGWSDDPAIDSWTGIITTISAALCVTGMHDEGFPLLERRSIRFIGKISYAWYLWQVPLLNITEPNGWSRGWTGYSNTAVSFVAAIVSTYWVEEPIRNAYAKFKKRRSVNALPV